MALSKALTIVYDAPVAEPRFVTGTTEHPQLTSREHCTDGRSVKRPTARQLEVLSTIADHVLTFGAPPSFRELGRALGFTSTNAGSDHLLRLERRGLLVRDRLKSRAYKITDAGWLALNRTAKDPGPIVSITGYCDPPSARCKACGRVFFRGSEAGHECRADDVACVRVAA